MENNRSDWKKALHFALIILVFTITGTSVAWIGGLISGAIGLEKYSLIWWVFTIIVIFPIYQVVLLLVAFLFGKFNYFFSKQRKIYRWINDLFSSDGGK